jgi:hypothetical protein
VYLQVLHRAPTVGSVSGCWKMFVCACDLYLRGGPIACWPPAAASPAVVHPAVVPLLEEAGRSRPSFLSCNASPYFMRRLPPAPLPAVAPLRQAMAIKLLFVHSPARLQNSRGVRQTPFGAAQPCDRAVQNRAWHSSATAGGTACGPWNLQHWWCG